MADTKLADLTALTAPSGDDLLYVVDDPAGTPADRKLALDNLFTRGTVTASSPVIDAAQTWNNAAVTFTGLKLNVTSTASASNSRLLDIQLGGASTFQVLASSSISAAYVRVLAGGQNLVGLGSLNANIPHVAIQSSGAYGWSISSDAFSGTYDLFLTRKAAASLRLGAADAASPVAQTLGVQSVVAGTTNTAGANFTIAGSQGTGSGAGGSIIFQVAPAGSSGTAQNALVDALTIGSNRSVIISAGSATLKRGATANYLIYENSGFDVFQVTGGEFNLVGNAILTWGNTNNTFTGYTADTILRRDAANTLALRNSTNAQAFNIYNTYTDASNYERGFVKWNTNVLKIGTEKAGTGTARALEFQTDGTTRLTISAAGDVTVAGLMNISSSGIRASSTGYGLFWSNSTTFNNRADGVLTISNYAENGFGRLQFGGTTSSFPALKRSTTSLQVRLADDSGYTNIQGKLTTETAYTAGAPTATGYIVLYDSTGTAYKVPAEAL